MAPGPNKRTEILQALFDEMRMGSTATVLWHQTIADALGLNPSDHKCLDFLYQSGPMTAGELAEAAGLTTGAITGVADRLEAKGFVRRAKDPGDRRRVVIEPMREAIDREIGPLVMLPQDGVRALSEEYSDNQLRLVIEFSTRSREIIRELTLQLRERIARS